MNWLMKLTKYFGYVPEYKLTNSNEELDKLRFENKVMKKSIKNFENNFVSKTELDLAVEQKSKEVTKQITKFFTEKRDIPNKDRLQIWSKTVRDEANNICDICNFQEDKTKPKNFSKINSSNFLTAHHLYDKKVHPSLMYIPENGICICNECHTSFHKKYTNASHCTPKMYQKFKLWKQGQIILGIKD